MIKKIIIPLIALSLLAGCARSKEIDGRVYQPYGLFSDDKDHSKQICYGVSAGNVIWSVIGVETIILPVWLAGFELYEPKYKAGPDGDCSSRPAKSKT